MKKTVVSVLCVAFLLCAQHTALSATLLSHYEFDGDADNSVGGAPNGIAINGPSYIAGYDGISSGAIQLNGSTQYITTGANGHPNASNGLSTGSISFWVKSDDTGDEKNRTIIGTLNAPPDATAFIVQFYEQTTPKDALRCLVRGYNYQTETMAKYTSSGDSSWRDGSWHHYACTWDSAAGSMTIYIDGVSVALSTSSGGAGIPTNLYPWENGMVIGAMNNRGSVINYYMGALDELRIYDGELTAAEVEDLAINPLKATLVSPADGSDNIPVTASLNWLAGQDPENPGNPNPDITNHILYLGTDPQNLAEEGIFTVGTTAHYPTLSKDSTYYWRVDEAITLPPYEPDDPNVFLGDVWTFETELSLPIIQQQPVDQWAKLGDNATFTIVSSDPLEGTLLYQWYKRGDPNVLVGVDADTLTINNVQETDAGDYFCKVSNSIGSVESDLATLTIARLVGHYKLDDGSGTVVADELGNNGTLNGTEDWLPGTDDADTFSGTGGALSMDGTSNYIDISTSGVPNASIGCYRGTISCWVRTSSSATGTITGSINDGAAETGIVVQLNLNTVEKARFYLRADGGHVISMSVGDDSWIDSMWHHFVFTWNASDTADNVIYIDGYPQELLSDFSIFTITSNDTIASWQYPLTIGACNSRGSIAPDLDGDMDDYRVYNYVLDGVEVATLYTNYVDDHICASPPFNDFNGDCVANLEDFAIFAGNWLGCGIVPDCF